MKIFLKLNRWIFILPFILLFLPDNPVKDVFLILGSVVNLLWLFAVSNYGQLQLILENLPSNNIKVFKIFFVAGPALILINYLIGQWLIDMNNAVGVVIFVLLVLASIFSVFYLYYFTAKTITMIERKRKVSLSECYYNFVLIILSGLGVFFLQPKIQKLINTDT